jgi:hypothetical protein
VTRREIPLDASALLHTLAAHGVEYVVIGGVAVQAHGHPRTTQDLDVVPEPSAENLKRLGDALSSLSARPLGQHRARDVKLPTTGVLELDTDAGGIDVHFDPPGAAPYPRLRARALEIQLDALVPVAGLDDLIAIKRASGRPIDLGDILALTEPDGTRR